MNALAILLSLRIIGQRCRIVRVLLGAAFGAWTAAAARAFGPIQGKEALLWFPVAAGMMGIAGGRRTNFHSLRAAGLLLCAEGLLGGVVSAWYGATDSLGAAYALGALCTGWVACCALRTWKTEREKRRAEVLCLYRGRWIRFDAMIDSGNTLLDYLTHAPVIVMPEGTGRRLFRMGNRPLRPIFADTAGGRQMMGCFLPEKIEIRVDGKRGEVCAAVAFAPGLRGEALVPHAVIRQAESARNH